MLEFKPQKDRIDVFDGPIFIASIYAHEKHISVVSKYLNKALPNDKALPNLVNVDLKTVPGVEIDFLI